MNGRNPETGDHPTQLDELLDQLCEGRLDSNGRKELNVLLRQDPANRARYLEYVDLHSSLWWSATDHAMTRIETLQIGAAVGASELGSKSTNTVEAASALRFLGGGHRWLRQAARRPWVASSGVAALVIGILLTAMAFMVPPIYRAFARKDLAPPANANRVVGEVTGLHDVVWASSAADRRRGAFLVPKLPIALESGILEITYRDGVVVLLEGPCEYIVEDLGRGKLNHGRLVASVPHSAVGFRVATPAATVVDLGTEFGIDVAASGSVEIHVFTGKIEWTAPNSDAPPQRLVQGEGVQIHPARHSSTRLVAAPGRFVRPDDALLRGGPRGAELLEIANASFEEGAAPAAGAKGWSIATGEGKNEFYTTFGKGLLEYMPRHGQEGPGSHFLTADRTALEDPSNPPNSLAKQSVDLAAFQDAIDAGAATLGLRFFYGTDDPTESSSVTVEFFDAAHQSIGSLTTSELAKTGEATWTSATLAGAIPDDARSFEIQIRASRSTGTLTNISFDNFAAWVITKSKPINGGEGNSS